jgi:hypothetical protein
MATSPSANASELRSLLVVVEYSGMDELIPSVAERVCTFTLAYRMCGALL